MKHLLVRTIAIIGLGSLLFVNIAFAETTEDPYTDHPSIIVELTGSLNSLGEAELSWNEYLDSDFQWYKVVHSQTNMEAVYPTDGYVEAKSDATLTTYTHTSVPAGTNYYRVCVITTDSWRGCSNTVTLEKVGDTTTDPAPVDDPYTDDSSIVVELTGSLNSLGKAELSWNEYAGGDLKWYKVVHSQTNDAAYYPVDGYVGVLSDAATTTYTHTSVPEGTNYYRVCVITDANLRGCSNTVTLEKGTTAVVTFDDVTTHWSKTYVEDLATKGVVEGRDGAYEPDAPIYRAEAVKVVMIALSFEEVTCDETLFPDTAVGDWFCGIVTKAYKKGVIQGDEGYFYPGRNITRAEAVKILLKAKGIEPPTLDADPFPDVPKSEWYAGYAYKAKVLGYVDGINGNFEPNKDITRAELAKIVSLASQ